MKQTFPNNTDQNKLEQLLQLLTDRAVHGLTAAQEKELQNLLMSFPDLDESALDSTAAAVELAFSLAQEPLPQHIRATIDQQCLRYFTEQAKQTTQPPAASVATTAQAASVADTDTDGIVAIPSKRRSRIRKSEETTWLSWIVAGFCLMLALLGWWPRLFSTAVSNENEEKSPIQIREEFIKSSKDIITMQWQAPEESENQDITGSMVWSHAAQQGYIMLENMPANNPGKQQYQLWIIDSTRSDQYPVSGAVFNASGDKTVIITVRPVLIIGQAQQFTITLESRGGVVVSDAPLLLTTTVNE